ncbi:MAG: Lrp/AsnC family transcriptional regulator [Chloroflexi bacterium]|nr:MAG: Lrp/AsnC family transcriptional regulator [Chloroflexota bacterium]
MKAFILIETTPGKARQVTTALKQLHGVKSADVVTGPYDVIAVLEAENMTNIATAKIKAIPGISRTVVCMTE